MRSGPAPEPFAHCPTPAFPLRREFAVLRADSVEVHIFHAVHPDFGALFPGATPGLSAPSAVDPGLSAAEQSHPAAVKSAIPVRSMRNAFARTLHLTPVPPAAGVPVLRFGFVVESAGPPVDFALLRADPAPVATVLFAVPVPAATGPDLRLIFASLPGTVAVFPESLPGPGVNPAVFPDLLPTTPDGYVPR